MTITVDDYAEIVGTDVIEELRVLADRVRDIKVQHINSTPVGGGVAEILTRLIPLMRSLGLETAWDVIKGDSAFFGVSKTFHNALHGHPVEITPEMFDVFRETTEMNAAEMEFSGDVIFVHDPQPVGLVESRAAVGRNWIWRCHIDLSAPNEEVWRFLCPFVEQYDAAIVSMPEFAQAMSIPQYLITPSIDPLSEKNKELEARYIESVLSKYGIDPGRPILTQISRFDRLKDPLGVIAAYRMVKRRFNCQLVLAGGGAADDPEGMEVFNEVREFAGDDPDVHILLLPPFSDLEINALIRGSTLVFQKSVKEGFGLTVSEALWKRKPVVGGAVGGIKLQVIDGVTGYLVHSPEGAASRASELLANPELCKKMGDYGYEHVKQNFLMTRQLQDYMLMLLAVRHPDEDIVNLE